MKNPMQSAGATTSTTAPHPAARSPRENRDEGTGCCSPAEASACCAPESKSVCCEGGDCRCG